ncbi:hypothetical protein scyTo_0006231 [Scyliorhinus torazame]|uniref:Uncharacterized protein n=1 Tax=Scyliorhinus torazame TaxID=75743 RepID=A0A401PGM0_SCYTO|nr:hypothetical protein [Scyliorhinus torazame]
MSNDASTLQDAVQSRQDEDTSATDGDEDSFFINTIMEDTERFHEIEETGTCQLDNSANDESNQHIHQNGH